MNKNHAPAGAANGIGGQFVSDDDASSQQAQAQDPIKKKAPAKKKASAKKPRVKKKNDEYEAFAAAFGPKFGSFLSKLSDFSQSSEVGFLSTPQEIVDNIGKIMSKNVVGHIDRLYGASTGCASYQFHPKSNPNVSLSIFTCVLGKYRFKNNHAHYITQAEYDKLEADPGFEAVYRGISSTGDRRKQILDGYADYDVDNLDIYGNGVYGTNVYTTTNYYYALNRYAGGDSWKVIWGLVAKDAKTVRSSSLESEQINTIASHGEAIRAAVLKAFEDGGVDPDRSQRITDSFMKALEHDESLYALIKGYDYQISKGHQRNILNLGKWYIRREEWTVS